MKIISEKCNGFCSIDFGANIGHRPRIKLLGSRIFVSILKHCKEEAAFINIFIVSHEFLHFHE